MGRALRLDDPTLEFYGLVDELKASQAGLDSVREMLLFMEDNPDRDYGVRGPLVHYMESFYRSGYEEELLDSVSRRPMLQNVSMLNALINGTEEPRNRREFIDALVAAGQHPSTDAATMERIEDYLTRLRDLGS